MTSKTKISFTISNSDISVPLGAEVWLDSQKIFDCSHVTEITKFEHEFDDNEAEHELEILMKNKTVEHTKLDPSGNIVKDACLLIDNFCFDELKIEHMFIELAEYVHDFNGSQAKVKDKFFGEMGCNGTVTFKFSTPIYLWLLENM